MRLDLSALLSQALVAFTVEFDNEFEHRMAHRTTVGGRAGTGSRGPWLASQVMWENVMRHVGDEGVSVADLHARARTTHDSLAGLQRWGYVVVEPGQAGRGRADGAHRDDLVRPTRHGRMAQDAWRPLATEIEERWRARFGELRIEALREALQAVVDQFDVDLPLYLPIVYPTKNGRAEVPVSGPAIPHDSIASRLDLSALLAQTLLRFTIDFEAQSRISLPISATTLRVLGGPEPELAVRVRDLPVLTGVSKEANAMVVGFLERHDCVVKESDPSATRGKVVRLTAKGRGAQDKYRRLLAATGEQWDRQFGRDRTQALRTSLVEVVGDVDDQARRSRLLAGMKPHPDGWRASVRPPETLPHYPMVLHRGGYPDGS
jgi:DNA-binding MarR family transcriptional regulator